MKNILIEVREKVASLKEGDSLICGNPYNITFDLDDEWADKLLRTARFVWRGKDGEPRFVDIPFSGDTVASPVLSDISQVFVGLYSGDLCTTTPALIPCQRSILCGGGVHEPPAEDVYNKIIELINSGAVKGEPGEKGEQGPPGEPGPRGEDGASEISATVNEETYEFTIELKDKEGKVVSSTNVTLPISNPDLSAYVKNTDRNQFVKEGVTENDISLTDKEKASACEWVGAVKKLEGNGATNILYGQLKDGTPQTFSVSSGLIAGAVVQRDPGNNTIQTASPTRATDATNKRYVDNLPTYRETMTDDEKTTWCEMLGAVKKQSSNSNYKIYGENAKGETTLFSIANTVANTGYHAIPWYHEYSSTLLETASQYNKYSLFTYTPIKPYAAANKEYVDNLPDYLTLTDEQKEKWKTWLENILN